MAAIGRKGGEARGNSARSAAARGGTSRTGETVRGSASETVRGGNADTIRPAERKEQARVAPSRMNDQDRTEQLRANEFPADQSRGNGRQDRDDADEDRELRGRDASGSDSRM
jgi:hypothetical protein